MPISLERDVIRPVIRWACQHDWLYRKIGGYGDSGWPDYVFVSTRGTHVWIEFKRPGKGARKLQQKRIELLQDHGALAYCFDNPMDAIEELADIHTQETGHGYI